MTKITLPHKNVVDIVQLAGYTAKNSRYRDWTKPLHRQSTAAIRNILRGVCLPRFISVGYTRLLQYYTRQHFIGAGYTRLLQYYTHGNASSVPGTPGSYNITHMAMLHRCRVHQAPTMLHTAMQLILQVIQITIIFSDIIVALTLLVEAASNNSCKKIISCITVLYNYTTVPHFNCHHIKKLRS